MLVILCCKRICTPNFRAEASSGRMSPAPDRRSYRGAAGHRHARLNQGPSHGRGVDSPRGAEFPVMFPGPCGAMSMKVTPWAISHSRVGSTVVGEGANDFPVVVPVVRKSVGFHIDQSVRSGRRGPANPRSHISSAGLCHHPARRFRRSRWRGRQCQSSRRSRWRTHHAQSASMAAGSPAAPAPTTTTSACLSQCGGRACASASFAPRPVGPPRRRQQPPS